MLKVKKWRFTVKNEFPRSKIKARYFANIRFYVKLSRILIEMCSEVYGKSDAFAESLFFNRPHPLLQLNTIMCTLLSQFRCKCFFNEEFHI